MFSPSNLQLKPSLPLALILGTPFVSSLVLISLASLPLISTLLLLLFACLCCFHFLRRYAFLSSKISIIKVESTKTEFFLTERCGQRYLATPLSGAIIHPWFSLLSFSCEALEEKETIQHKPPISDKSSFTEKHTLAVLFEALCKRIQYSVSRKTIRHVIICRYNVANLNDYRRLRVTLKFN